MFFPVDPMKGAFLLIANLMIALCLGYVVVYFANQEEQSVRRVGMIIGTFVVTLSLLLIWATLFLSTRMYNAPEIALGCQQQRRIMQNNVQPPSPLPK
jgi:hypothetical protein